VSNRIRSITHHGEQILIVDFTNCSPADAEDTLRALPDHVTSNPRGSVLILADFTDASFSEETIRTMQQTAVFDKPYVKKSAWVGTENLPDSIRDSVSKFSRREFTVFKNRIEALEWLTAD